MNSPRSTTNDHGTVIILRQRGMRQPLRRGAHRNYAVRPSSVQLRSGYFTRPKNTLRVQMWSRRTRVPECGACQM